MLGSAGRVSELRMGRKRLTIHLTGPSSAVLIWLCRYLDVAAMQEAAQHLLGTHNFSAFQSAGSPATNAVRTLQRVSVSPGPASPFVLPEESR